MLVWRPKAISKIDLQRKQEYSKSRIEPCFSRSGYLSLNGWMFAKVPQENVCSKVLREKIVWYFTPIIYEEHFK